MSSIIIIICENYFMLAYNWNSLNYNIFQEYLVDKYILIFNVTLLNTRLL